MAHARSIPVNQEHTLVLSLVRRARISKEGIPPSQQCKKSPMSMIPSNRVLESETHTHPRIQDRPLEYEACKHTTRESSSVKILRADFGLAPDFSDSGYSNMTSKCCYPYSPCSAAPDTMERFEAGDEDDNIPKKSSGGF